MKQPDGRVLSRVMLSLPIRLYLKHVREIFSRFIIFSGLYNLQLKSFNPCRYSHPLKYSTFAGISQSTGNVEVYNYPRISPRSNDYKCKAGGNEIFVYQTSAGPFAAFSSSGAVNIEIEMLVESKNVSISPKRYGILPDVNGRLVSFTVPSPMLLALEMDGMPVLYIYINPLEKNAPVFNAPNVQYFKAGQVYEVGELYLHDNEILYIEGERLCVAASELHRQKMFTLRDSVYSMAVIIAKGLMVIVP